MILTVSRQLDGESQIAVFIQWPWS